MVEPISHTCRNLAGHLELREAPVGGWTADQLFTPHEPGPKRKGAASAPRWVQILPNGEPHWLGLTVKRHGCCTQCGGRLL